MLCSSAETHYSVTFCTNMNQNDVKITYIFHYRQLHLKLGTNINAAFRPVNFITVIKTNFDKHFLQC